MAPFAEAATRLLSIPGVGKRVAEVIVAEIGVDMSRFPTGKHLASWVGLCPGHHESAGKRRSGKLATGATYDDLGAGFFERRINTEARQRNLVRQLEALGHIVTLQPAA